VKTQQRDYQATDISWKQLKKEKKAARKNRKNRRHENYNNSNSVLRESNNSTVENNDNVIKSGIIFLYA
jgi:hypothetical protein